jgi:transposase
MLARQLKDLAPYIARYEKQIEQLFSQHPDRGLFENLPGAGEQLAPRLLSAFGSDRDRFPSAVEALTFFGVAPITERSGKTTWIHFRWACPKFLRQSFHESAAHSVRFCDWPPPFMSSSAPTAKAIMLRCAALAYKWIRIPVPLLETRQPYNPDLYLAALSRRSSPLATAVKNSP